MAVILGIWCSAAALRGIGYRAPVQSCWSAPDPPYVGLMSLAGVPNGPVRFAYDGSEKAKAAIRQAGRRLCDGRRAIAMTVWTSPDQDARRLADERDADIVAVGSHGRTGIIRLLLESIADATPSDADGPVLIVNDG